MRYFRCFHFLLLLFFCTPSLAKNALFEKMCKSPFLDIPFGWSAAERYDEKNSLCKQKYALVATQEQAELLCLNAMPYDVKETKTNGNEVICSWTYSGECTGGTGGDYLIQVYEKCYRISSSGCFYGDVRASPKTDDQIRWISRALALFGTQGEPLLVETNRKLEEMKITDRFYDKGVMFPNNDRDEKNLKWAMVISPHQINGLRPGNLIKAKVYANLCEKSQMRTGSSKVDVDPISAKESKATKEGRVFATKSYYQPMLSLSDKQINVEYFHKVCSEICTDCIAASGDILQEAKAKLAPGSYWVPVNRKSKTASNKCEPEVDLTKRKSFKSLAAIKYNKNELPIPLDSEWLETSYKWPRDECSDGDRFGVQFFIQGDGKSGYVDVPVFDYKPIICYQGVLPKYRPGANACYKNSEMKGGKCDCKSGFTDALKVDALQGLVKTLGYTEEGYICVGPPHCVDSVEDVIPYQAFMYLGDGSGTMAGTRWAKVLPFLRMFEPNLPKTIPIYLQQWSSDKYDCKTHTTAWWCANSDSCPRGMYETSFAKTHCPEKDLAILEPGWTKEQFDREAAEIFTKCQNGWTLSYQYIIRAADWWIQYKKDKGIPANEKAFMVFVTDHDTPQDTKNEDLVVQKVAEAKIKFVAVDTGYEQDTFRRFWGPLMDNFATDHIQANENGNFDFTHTLKDTIIKQICTYSERDVYRSI